MSAGPINKDMVWQADSSHLLFVELGEIPTVFDRRSGDTHILNFLSKAIIDSRTKEQLTAAVLSEKVLAEIEMTQEDCPPSLVYSTLSQLDELGLVQLAREE
jgi:PqqD family protein of HPr-rel-A system